MVGLGSERPTFPIVGTVFEPWILAKRVDVRAVIEFDNIVHKVLINNKRINRARESSNASERSEQRGDAP